MAQFINCNHGHYYDKDLYPACPYCKKTAGRFRSEIPIFDPGPVLPPKEDEDKTKADDPLNQKYELKGLPSNIPPVQIEIKTESIYQYGAGSRQWDQRNPVTGWLVCIGGSCKGMDFRIRHGQNWIGASPSNDISIPDDPEIEKEKHCSIVYDPKEARFYVVQHSGALTYHNDIPVEQKEILLSGDTIQLGYHIFEFIPFCREGHAWENIAHRSAALEESVQQ